MRQRFKLIESELKRRPGPIAVPTFLIRVDPWHKTFFRNLRDLMGRSQPPALRVVARPGTFWDDVFVADPLPWSRFAQSAVGHAAVIAMLWGFSALWPQGSRVTAPSVFHSSDVVYYSAQEYLQPLDTGGEKARLPQKADPAYAPQPIISVPPEPDNRRQTIVTPPKIKLEHDVPLPNVVAWGPAQPAVPLAATSRAMELRLPEMTIAVVAPPPEVRDNRLDAAPTLTETAVAPAPSLTSARSNRNVRMPEPSVVEPPPSVQTTSVRRVGDINIGHAQVVAPAPQLPVGEQRAVATLAQGPLGAGPAVVPPPPSVPGRGVSGAGGRMIALNVNPAAPSASVEVPAGNRRGTFAAMPEGKTGATGAPEIAAGGKAASAFSRRLTGDSGAPPGLFVGAGPKSEASLTVAGTGRPAPPSSGSSPSRSSTSRKIASEMSPDSQTEAERRVFAGRRTYAMTLSVPNLNSAGGSWVMHFVEQKEDEKKGDLVAPVATRTADPGYPLELMRQNVRGTVILSAVINADGTVGNVQVLNGIDDRLDDYASSALSRWQFLPALKDGNPVALQAVVMIPFRPRPEKSGF
ncbi:MAG: energy transducer TonB [Terriglobales bacterium]